MARLCVASRRAVRRYTRERRCASRRLVIALLAHRAWWMCQPAVKGPCVGVMAGPVAGACRVWPCQHHRVWLGELLLLFWLQAAQKRYEAATGGKPERLVSGSDDYTMFLWQPSTSKQPVARMTGHVQLINQVSMARARMRVVHSRCWSGA
jgi:hypothetical protein